MDIDKIVGENIKYYRKKRGMTQAKLGEIIGVRNNTISQYEKGRNAPEQNMIYAIANALGVSISDLFPETTNNKEESFMKALMLSEELNEKDREYLQSLIEKAHSLDEKAREDFFKNIRFAVEYFDRNM